ncbi:MAG: hypothetical protein MUP81_02240 [Dehalococcoidia bacterium]|nr:hypothetical protein [Dehalococcoidia bacterium]
MSPKANKSHDISFVDPSTSKEVGLMLAWKTDSRGNKLYPLYNEYDDPTLANQIYSGEPSYANLPPEKEIQIGQNDWRAGMGQGIYDPSDDKRYWYSSYMDLRFKGRAMLGPKKYTATIPTGIVRAWYEFNDDLYIASNAELCRLNGIGTAFGGVATLPHNITDLEEFTDGKGYIAIGGTNKYYYMTAELVVETCEAAWDEHTETDVTCSADTTDYMNGTASAKFVIATGLAAGDIIATHNFTAKNLTAYTEISLWIKSSVALSAGDLHLLLDDSAECATPLEALDIPAVSANTWTSVHKTFVTPAALGAVVSIGLSMEVEKGAFNLWVDDVRVGSYTESVQADGMADFFQTVDTTLWKAVLPNEIKTATAPETAWTSEDTVGSTAQDITGLLEESGQLYVMKEDMPYYFDTSKVVHRLIPELKSLESSTGGANSIVWKAKLYMPYGTADLVEYDSGVTSWRSPSLYFTQLDWWAGRVNALASDEQFLFAIIGNTDDSTTKLLAGREEEIDGVDRWVWHPLPAPGASGCQTAFVSSIYKKRLYIAKTTSGTGITYFPLPTKYGNIDGDTDYIFQDGEESYFITPWLHANFKGDNKAFIKLTLTMEDTSTTEYFTAYYQLKGAETSFTEIGDFKTSPTTTKYIPVNYNSANPIGIMIQFKIRAYTGDDTTTPSLLGYDCRGIWYPEKRWLINCSVLCADNITRKDGQVDNQTASEIETAITDATAGTWPITFYDPDGSTIYVKVLSAQKVMTKCEKDKSPEFQYNLVLMKTVLS